MRKKRVVLFCGGSGGSELVKMYTAMDHVELTILVNCYDDGLSTGVLRDCIPGMLGPSDIRKNVRHSLQQDTDPFAGLDRILGYRFPDDSQEPAIPARPLTVLRKAGLIGSLSRRRASFLEDAVERFSTYVEAMTGCFSFRNVSLGNVVFAGIYLAQGDFNEAVRTLVEFAGIRNQVLNLTDGADLRLVGLTDGGLVIPDESGLSCLRSSDKVADIFLLEDYLTEAERRLVEKVGERAKQEYLAERSRVPRMNPEARDAIRNADVIIYWPGTQHSSLFPSYLTDGLAEAVMESRARRKFLITNIWRDNDICNESAFSLVEKFFWFMSRKGSGVSEAEGLVTDMLLNAARVDTEGRCLPLGLPTRLYRGASIDVGEWGDRGGKHDVRKTLTWLN